MQWLQSILSKFVRRSKINISTIFESSINHVDIFWVFSCPLPLRGFSKSGLLILGNIEIMNSKMIKNTLELCFLEVCGLKNLKKKWKIENWYQRVHRIVHPLPNCPSGLWMTLNISTILATLTSDATNGGCQYKTVKVREVQF